MSEIDIDIDTGLIIPDNSPKKLRRDRAKILNRLVSLLGEGLNDCIVIHRAEDGGVELHDGEAQISVVEIDNRIGFGADLLDALELAESAGERGNDPEMHSHEPTVGSCALLVWLRSPAGIVLHKYRAHSAPRRGEYVQMAEKRYKVKRVDWWRNGQDDVADVYLSDPGKIDFMPWRASAKSKD